MTPTRRPLLKRRDVAERLSVKLRTLDKLPLRKILIATSPGQKRPAVRYDPDEIDAYIESIKQVAVA